MAHAPLSEDTAVVAAYCEQYLVLRGAVLAPEYFYQSLPLCVVDTVYSIGVKYEGVQNVVRRYCEYFGLREFRESRHRPPAPSEQESLSAFLEKIRVMGIEKFTADVFQNRQRTSTRNGILKSEAVFRFAEVLHESDLNFLQDVPSRTLDASLEEKLRRIPGQRSGISVGYFFMLAGTGDLIKPDRRILSFLTRCLRRSPSLGEAQSLLSGACEILLANYPGLSPRLLDNVIWNYERARD